MINWHTSETETNFGGLQVCTGLASFFYVYNWKLSAYYFYDVLYFFTLKSNIFFFFLNLATLQTI